MTTADGQGSATRDGKLRRRGFLGFLLGGVAALFAGRAATEEAQAATGQPWILGVPNDAQTPTGLFSDNQIATLDIANIGGGFGIVASDQPVFFPPSGVTQSATILGLDLSVEPGFGGEFFKQPSARGPNVGVVGGLTGVEGIADISRSPVRAGGFFLEGPVGRLGDFPVTVTAGALSFSRDQVASQAMTEGGVAMVAQVLGEGTGVHAVQESPAGDAVSVSGRLTLSRCYQVTVPRHEDTFIIEDPFVTDMTVAVANFTADPHKNTVEWVAPTRGVSMTFHLSRKAHDDLTLNVALIC